jgi:4-amino-4-deoxy-L-arabinose transferase-like glycosyltransferase
MATAEKPARFNLARINLAWLAVLPLLGWWFYGLFDLDEGYYAAVAAEMNRRGQWITPYYNGHPWFEKPILLYWVAKPCLALFGDMVGPRLPSVLATLGTYAVVWWFARRRFGAPQASRAVLVLGSSLLVIGIGRMMLTDPLLDLALAAAFATYWESIVGDWRWRLVTAFSLGMGVLAKGPVCVLLFAPVAAITAWRLPDLRPRMGKGWLIGTVILLAVVGSWYVPAYLVNGHTFVQQFLIEQNFDRFTGGDSAHTVAGIGGLLFYVVILAIGMPPWSWRITDAWRFSRKDPVVFYLKTWVLVVFVFFTISGAKLPHYILPACPPLAMLIADELEFARYPMARMAAWTVLVSLIANLAFFEYYRSSGQADIHDLARYIRSHARPGDTVAEYGIGKESKDQGTLKPRLQQTSEPSVLLYLNRDVIDTESWSDVADAAGRVWLITLAGDETPYLRPVAGKKLVPVDSGWSQNRYKLILMEPDSPRSASGSMHTLLTSR